MGGGVGMGGQVSEKIIDDHLAVQAIIRSYQVRNSYSSLMSLCGVLIVFMRSSVDISCILVTLVMEGQF